MAGANSLLPVFSIEVITLGKRNSGEGGFFHDIERDIWIYQIRYTDNEGNRKRKKFAAKTKREAMQKGQDFIAGIEQGFSDSDTKLTVGNWVRNWLENYAKPHVRPRTYEKYSSSLNKYILPKYENILLGDLKVADLQNHFNILLKSGRTDGTGLSSSTVRGTRRCFSMCVDDAVKLGLIQNNVVRLTKAPKLSKKEIVILSKDEVSRLIDEAKKINNSFMKIMMPEIISLTVHTGLRQGEVFGLKWGDIDFKNSCLFVRRSLAHVIGKGAVFQSPKTKNSIRRVLLMSDDIESLKKYQQWQENLAEELGDKFAGHGLVFTSPFGEPISPTNFIRRYFKPLLKKCGIHEEFTFHGLRHTHATLLLQQGVNPKIVQERLGHSSIKVTMDTYSHVLPDMQKQAVDALQGIFQ